MSEEQQEIMGGDKEKDPLHVVEPSRYTPLFGVTRFSRYLVLTLFIVLPVLAGWMGYQYGKSSLPYVDQAPEVVLKNDDTASTAIGTSTNLIKYTDADNRFSLEYPQNLTPVVEKNEMYNTDSIRFKNASGTAFSISFWRVNERWPDLQAFLNDQIFASKGGEKAPVKKITLPSGIQLIDGGGNPFDGYGFYVQLKKSEYIGISFYDKSLVEQVLSSLNFATGTVGSDVESNIPQGWKVFSNTEYGFEIGYPTDYTVTNKQIFTEKILPGSWRIYQVGELPRGHSPKTIGVEIIDPNEIYGNDLGGTYTKYDPERGLCYTYSISNSERSYLTEKINGYAVCKHSAGDAGSFGSNIIFIYPNKTRALKVSTGGDETQKSAPLNDFAKTVRLLNN